MINYTRKQFYQERLSRDDIHLMLEAIETSEHLTKIATDTRIELLKGKLKRMEKQ